MSGTMKWENLNHENINMEIDDLMQPIMAKNSFVSGRQRTAVQVAAVAEDVKLQNTLASLCEKLSSAFGVIPLQGAKELTEWDSSKDEDIYRRTAQQYLVVMDTSDKRLVRALPSIGQKVEIQLKLGYDKSNFPAIKMTASQVDNATQYVLGTVQPEGKIFESSSDETDTEVNELNLWLQSSASSKTAMQRLARVLLQFSETDSQRTPDPDKASQAAHAILSAIGDGSGDMKLRIKDWIIANPWFKFSPENTQWTEVKWSGKRVKTPPGVRSSKAFFQVVTPGQPRWPFSQRPRVRVAIPSSSKHDTLQATIEAMALGIRGKLMYIPDVKVQWFEGHVHDKLNVLEADKPVTNWWNYIMDFQTMHPDFYRNLHDEFPGLSNHIAAGKFQGEHAVVAQSLTKTKAGKFILHGCPGSGKSTFCQRLASAVVYQGWRPHAVDAERPLRLPGQARVIYTSPQNEQCRDAIKRFKILNPDKRACRLYGYNRELQALIRGDDHAEPEQDEGANSKATDKLHEALVQHTKRSAVEHDNPRNPRLDPDSLSSIARTTATRQVLEKLRRSWELWKRDKARWASKEEEFKKLGHEQLVLAVKSFDALFGTLVAVAQCHDHMDKDKGVLGSPALLIVDEVGRLTETHALIGVSLWKEVPTVFTGDHEQLGPIVDTAGTQFSHIVGGEKFEFRSVFSAQYGTSFLARAAAQGGIDAHLTSNHRVYGSAGEFPCEVLYDGNMTQTHTEANPATEAVSEWFARHGESGKNSLFVDLSSNEMEQGTSKINPTSAYFVVQLAVDIAREMKLPLMEDYKKFDNPLENTASIRKGRILILVAYAAQKVQVLSFLKRISPHELDKSRISVRTIDDSPSHEAEIVVVDLVRTEAIGFLGEPARLKVAATRAQLGTIWVAHAGLCQRARETSLKKLFDYHMRHKALVSVGGYNAICKKCCRAGHLDHQCLEKNLRCKVCSKNSRETSQHAARNCRYTTWPTQSEWDKERWMSEAKAADSVVREPLITTYRKST